MPWRGADGKPLQNVSEFAEYMDFVNIMSVTLPVTVFFPDDVTGIMMSLVPRILRDLMRLWVRLILPNLLILSDCRGSMWDKCTARG